MVEHKVEYVDLPINQERLDALDSDNEMEDWGLEIRIPFDASEQGTSASHLIPSRFVDAIAHMPGMSGEDSDATGAYTQTEPGPDCPPTWITLPR